MIDHSTTLVRAYCGALIYYLVLLELDSMAHISTTAFIKIRVAKVDLNAGMQIILPYKHT